MANKKIAIVGSIYFLDKDTHKTISDQIIQDNGYTPTAIYCGEGRGTDDLTSEYATESSYYKKIFKKDFLRHGKMSKYKIIDDIIEACDVCICFTNGYSIRCEKIIMLCRLWNKPCHIYNYNTSQLTFEENA